MIDGLKKVKFCVALSSFLLLGQMPTALGQSPASDLESEFLMELLLDVDPQLDAGHTSIAVSYTHLTLPTKA